MVGVTVVAKERSEVWRFQDGDSKTQQDPHTDRRTDTPESRVRQRDYIEDAYQNDEEPVVAVCCLKGCLAGTTVAVLLLLILPAGILVTVYSRGNHDDTYLALGIVLICVPIIVIPLVILCLLKKCHKCRRSDKS